VSAAAERGGLASGYGFRAWVGRLFGGPSGRPRGGRTRAGSATRSLEHEYAEALRAGGAEDFGCPVLAVWSSRGSRVLRSARRGRARDARRLRFGVRGAIGSRSSRCRRLGRADSALRLFGVEVHEARWSGSSELLGVESLESRCWGPSGFSVPRFGGRDFQSPILLRAPRFRSRGVGVLRGSWCRGS
jgi:hypothetical protein